MKQGFTRIKIVLDRSGSMADCRESTITGYNAFINEQKAIPGECMVDLVQFDNEYLPVYSLPLKDVPELTQATFEPRANTALYDAQGRAIVELGKELAALPEDQRPEKVVVMTITDGLENASTDFTREKVATLIKEHREKYNWQFMYFGANQDAVKVAAAMNIPRGQTMTYGTNSRAIHNTMAAVSSNMSSYRRAVGQNVQMRSFMEEERSAALAPDDDDANSLGNAGLGSQQK
jgi:O6-methylguanine-DNA--protein-cysteine methyltransferase